VNGSRESDDGRAALGELIKCRPSKVRLFFLAEFASDAPPFNRLDEISRWAAGLGYKGVQIPTWDRRLIDPRRAAESRSYCNEILGTLDSSCLELTEPQRTCKGSWLQFIPPTISV
jgi:hypothetical protein